MISVVSAIDDVSRLSNRLENADRASEEGVPVELVAAQDGGRVRLGVLDRGRGFASVEAGRAIAPGDVLPRGAGELVPANDEPHLLEDRALRRPGRDQLTAEAG